VYVADSGNYRIQKFNSSATFLTKWGTLGWSDGQFGYDLSDVAADGAGNVFVVDGNGKVQKFDSTGVFLMTFPPYSNTDSLRFPLGVTVDESGCVYAVAKDGWEVRKYKPQ